VHGSVRSCPACRWLPAERRSTGSGPEIRVRANSLWTGFLPSSGTVTTARACWGHGSAEDYGIKIGPEPLVSDRAGIDPEEMDRYIHLDTDVDELTAQVAQALPGLAPRPAKVIPCLVTDSPDGQFLVGRLPSQPRVVIAGGDSGHGFKHAAGIGELLAQIVADEPRYCAADFLDPARFHGTMHARSG